ncbi:conserved hypothetical protein, partial [Ricinus communis]
LCAGQLGVPDLAAPGARGAGSEPALHAGQLRPAAGERQGRFRLSHRAQAPDGQPGRAQLRAGAHARRTVQQAARGGGHQPVHRAELPADGARGGAARHPAAPHQRAAGGTGQCHAGRKPRSGGGSAGACAGSVQPRGPRRRQPGRRECADVGLHAVRAIGGRSAGLAGAVVRLAAGPAPHPAAAGGCRQNHRPPRGHPARPRVKLYDRHDHYLLHHPRPAVRPAGRHHLGHQLRRDENRPAGADTVPDGRRALCVRHRAADLLRASAKARAEVGDRLWPEPGRGAIRVAVPVAEGRHVGLAGVGDPADAGVLHRHLQLYAAEGAHQPRADRRPAAGRAGPGLLRHERTAGGPRQRHHAGRLRAVPGRRRHVGRVEHRRAARAEGHAGLRRHQLHCLVRGGADCAVRTAVAGV